MRAVSWLRAAVTFRSTATPTCDRPRPCPRRGAALGPAYASAHGPGGTRANFALARAGINHGVTLGTDTAVAAGTLGDSGDAKSKSSAKDIYMLVDVGGLFAGVSLDGTVVGSRQDFNRAYYGPEATTSRIVIERRFAAPGAARLHAALTAR